MFVKEDCLARCFSLFFISEAMGLPMPEFKESMPSTSLHVRVCANQDWLWDNRLVREQCFPHVKLNEWFEKFLCFHAHHVLVTYTQKNLVLYSCSVNINYFDFFFFIFFSDKFLFVSYPSSSSANPSGWICITIKRVYSQGMCVGGWVWRNMSKYVCDLWISFHLCDIFWHVGSFFSVRLCACVVECAFNTEWEIPSVIQCV